MENEKAKSWLWPIFKIFISLDKSTSSKYKLLMIFRGRQQLQKSINYDNKECRHLLIRFRVQCAEQGCHLTFLNCLLEKKHFFCLFLILRKMLPLKACSEKKYQQNLFIFYANLKLIQINFAKFFVNLPFIGLFSFLQIVPSFETTYGHKLNLK